MRTQIIELLGKRRVLGVSINTSKDKLTLTEGRDGYHDVDLSKEELAELIKELQSIYWQMVEAAARREGEVK